MAQDEEKHQLEVCSIKEVVSLANSKKRRRPKNNNTTEKKVIPIVRHDLEVDDRTCSLCLKSFNSSTKKANHLRGTHKITSRTAAMVKCNECEIKFFLVNKLRQHLDQVHGIRMTEESHTFPNMDAFKVWKLNIEKKEGVFFKTHNFRRMKQQILRYHYVCNRTGVYKPPPRGPKNRNYYRGTCKMGIYCTAGIICLESKDEVKVRYWPQHYGHWNDTASELPLDKDESNLEEENVTGSDSFNDVLKDVRSYIISQTIQPSITRKRDQQLLTEAFESGYYNFGLSDSESVDHWVRLCLRMEDSPVLCYKQELADDSEEFLLIIMTEFQKQLLIASEKKVICVDCSHRQKGRRFYLSCISIVDECDVAFPVAFCISNKVNESVFRQFLMSVKKATGPLSFTYFMSDIEQFYFDVWKDIMNDNSKWLWSMWFMDYNIKVKLRSFFKSSDFEKKVGIYGTTRTLIECHSQTIFESIFKKYLDSLLDDYHPATKKFGELIYNKYSQNVERWAYCYRTDMKTSTSFQLEALHRTLRLYCREGTKTRLDKFIFALMKFVKWKMLDRLTNILDDEKIEMVRDTINMCHKAGLDIAPMHISSLSDKIWLVKSEDEEENVYVVRDSDSCKEHCMMRCAECDICVHMYSCSCIPSMINANLCQHIHAVVWKFLTPHHFSPIPSPTLDDNAYSDSSDTLTAQKNPGILESILNLTHEIYNSVKNNKSTFSKEELTLINSKLREAKKCVDVCSKKKATLNAEENVQQVSFLPHSDLPPSQNSVLQPLVSQALQPNVKDNSSQTLVLSQTVLPQNNSLSQRYVLYVPFNKLNKKET